MQALDTKLQRDFGIAFEDKTLLETAFTHTSYANETSPPKHFTQ